MRDFRSVTYDVCRRYLLDEESQLGPQVAKKIHGWIRSRNLKALASCSDLFWSPAYSCDRQGLRVLMQIEAFFKKNASFAERDSCESAAAASFERGEKLCRITNRRLDHYCVERDRLDPDLNLWLAKASRFISRTLGPYSRFLEEMPELVRVTSGATSSRSRRNALPPFKISKRPVCTRRALPYYDAMSRFYGYGSVRGKLVEANRVEVVPKNWKTDRTIACEPDGNLPFQLAFDTYAKRRLRFGGIDLSDQSRNQSMAREGSVSGRFATIDLSMASDTLAYNTVVELLPHDWFRFLDDVRSPMASGRFGTFRYAKFSSMGNGATFALETLIFASACYAVGAKEYVVYGDDIVIETELAEPLLRFLRFLGFLPNTDKSYLHGPFRESCGTNWYEGVDFTPFYLRKWSGSKMELSHNINGLVKASRPYGQLWHFLKSLVDEWGLPLTPWSEDTESGVHVDAHTCYSKGVIKTKGWVPRYKSYVRVSRTKAIVDSRSYFLWHLQASRDLRAAVLPGGPLEESLVTSGYATSSHKYVRKWVRWVLPTEGAPPHVYTWGDFLVRNC